MVAASQTKTMTNSVQAMNLHAVGLISMPPTYDICLIPHVARFSPVRSVASRLFPPCLRRFSVRVLVAILTASGIIASYQQPQEVLSLSISP